MSQSLLYLFCAQISCRVDIPIFRRYLSSNLPGKKLKYNIRILRFALRISSFILSGITMATMILTLVKFYQTRHTLRVVQEPNGPVTRGPWAAQSSIWSTYLLLTTSVVTFLGNLYTLASYCKGIKSANKANDVASGVGYMMFAIHASLWVATAAAYRAAKTGSDLWGWSCKGQGMVELQESFQGVVNFRKQCRVQSGSWVISILEAIVGVLSVVIFGLAYKRLGLQRRIGAAKESRMSWIIPTRR